MHLPSQAGHFSGFIMKCKASTRRRLGAALAVVGLSTWARQAGATTFVASWIGTIGSWTTASNWSTNPNFPNNSSGANYDAVINKSTATVTLNTDITVNHFSLLSGKLVGDRALFLTAGGTWGGGNISGTGTFNILGNSFAISGADHGLSDFTFNTQPTTTVNWTSGGINSVDDEGGVFNNEGTFNDQTDAPWLFGVNQSPTFNNHGLYIKGAGTPQVIKDFQTAFNNNGTVDIRSGNLWLEGGGDSSGTFLVSAGSILSFSDFNDTLANAGAPATFFEPSAKIISSGTISFQHYGAPYNLAANTTFDGSYQSAFTVIDPGDDGHVIFNPGSQISSAVPSDWQILSGHLSLSTGTTVYMNNLDMEAGALEGSDDRVVQGQLTFNGGRITGPSNTYATNGMSIGGIGAKEVRFATLINQNAGAAWTDGTILLTNSSIYNDPGATFDAQFDGTIENNLPGAQAAFVNSGTFMKSAGTGVTNLDQIEIFNSGTILVQSGTLRLGGGGDHTGTISVAAGATVVLDATTFGTTPIPQTFEPGSVITGPAGSTVYIAGSTSFLAGANVNTDELRIEGPVTSQGSFSTGTGDIDNGGVLRLSTSATWSNANAINIGPFNSGTLTIQSGARVSSQYGGLAGSGSLSAGTVILTGAGSRWDISQFIQVGGNGAATLLIDQGAILSDPVGDSGGVFAPTGSAIITVQTGGQWINSDFLRVGSSGTTTLNITSGGQVSDTIGDMASATGSAAVVSVSGVGSSWINSQYLSVATSGNASLTISGGGLVQSSIGFIGNTATAVGSMLVSAAGSRYIDSDFLSVGDLGKGTLSILSAGTVSCRDLLVGDQTSGIGTLSIDGANSSMSATNNTLIGNFGHGTLSITNGAHMTGAQIGFIGEGTSGVGVASVSGAGSRWDLQNQLGVGILGTGSLTISNGAIVTCKGGLSSPTGSDAVTGRFGPGVGTILVTGPGSQLNCLDGHLNVGFGSLNSTDSPGGKGNLIVTNGGAVTSLNGYIGRTVGGVGTATIGGGTGTSSWAMSGSLFLAGDDNAASPTGGGTLIINDSGLVTAPTKVKAWNNGTIVWNAGSFSTSDLELTGGGKMFINSNSVPKTLRVHTLSIDSVNTSFIDMGADNAVINYTGSSPINNIRNLLIAGRNGGIWTGPGIRSTVAATIAFLSSNPHKTALGFAEASSLGLTSFHGQSVDSTSVLIGYGFVGDANLDGKVNALDFNALASNFGKAGTNFWNQGDFNYDGAVNTSDFTMLAGNFNQALPSPALGTLAPEPTMVGALVAAAPLKSRRRRRQPP